MNEDTWDEMIELAKSIGNNYYSVDGNNDTYHSWTTTTSGTSDKGYKIWAEKNPTKADLHYRCRYCGDKVTSGIVADGYIFCSKQHLFLNKLKEASKESILK